FGSIPVASVPGRQLIEARRMLEEIGFSVVDYAP
ncbi:hypothetical protein KIPB_015624, partial [Kipferlia bialata]